VQGKNARLMPDYSVRSESFTNKSDELIGPCPNPRVALEKINQTIRDNGKRCNAQLTIKAFAFEDEGNNILCDTNYYLVETLNGKEMLYQLFPRGNLDSNFFRTTTAAGSFTVST
jgi:hypothetical protein